MSDSGLFRLLPSVDDLLKEEWARELVETEIIAFAVRAINQ